jgi:DegV family protein with EDD domain
MRVEMSIEIVTDSTADIPDELLENSTVHVVPAILVIDGQSLEDGPGISRKSFYERLPTMQTLPTTSAPSVGSFLKLYERLFHKGVSQIVSIHAPAALSGIFNAARLAAQNFGGKVRVLDSGQLSLGLGFQALAAGELAQNGSSLETVLNYIENIRQRVHVVAMLDTFEYVRRSGRVSWAKAALGTLLNIKPFVGIKDGIVLRLGEARTRLKGIERLLTLLQNLGPLEKLAVLHTNAEEDAHSFYERLNPKLAIPPTIVNVTTIIGTHVGPKGLGFAAVTR